MGSLKLKKYTSERRKESYGLFQYDFLRFLGYVTFAQATCKTMLDFIRNILERKDYLLCALHKFEYSISSFIAHRVFRLSQTTFKTFAKFVVRP
jgi:hypothetical protein